MDLIHCMGAAARSLFLRGGTMPLTISTQLFAPAPLGERELALIAASGFRAVELWAMRPHLDYTDPCRISALREELERLGLRVQSIHAPIYASFEEVRRGKGWLSLAHGLVEERRRALEETKRAALALQPLGAEHMVVHSYFPYDPEMGYSAEGLESSLRALLSFSRALGLKVALENVPGEEGAVHRMIALVEELRSPDFGLCLDVGHANLQGNPLEEVERVLLLPYVFNIHLHDNDGHEDAHLIPGEGTLPWGEIGEALRERNYGGLLTLEIRRKRDAASILQDIPGRIQGLLTAGPSRLESGRAGWP